jgi:anti-sigma factor RsiW
MGGKESMMNCSEVGELAPLYLSGELDAAAVRNFRAHLEGCSACSEEIERAIHFDERLRAVVLSDAVSESGVASRVRQQISSDSSAQFEPNSRPPAARRWVIVAAGIAAAVLLTALGYAGLLGPELPRVYADAALDHQNEVVDHQPRRWFVDPSQIAALAGHLGVSESAVMAAPPVGYHLVHAKLCWLDSRLFVHLVYSDGSNEYSLFLRHSDVGRDAAYRAAGAESAFVQTSGRQGEHLVSFEVGELTAVVVTNQPQDVALRLSRSIAAAL